MKTTPSNRRIKRQRNRRRRAATGQPVDPQSVLAWSAIATIGTTVFVAIVHLIF